MSSKLGVLGVVALQANRPTPTAAPDSLRGGCPFSPPPSGSDNSSNGQQQQAETGETQQQGGFWPVPMRVA